MITLQRMRNWQKVLMLPLFIGICISFGVTGAFTQFFSGQGDRPYGEIYGKKFMMSDYIHAANDIHLLRAFFDYYPELARSKYQQDFDPTRLFDMDTYMSAAMLSAHGQYGERNYLTLIIDGLMQSKEKEDEAWTFLLYDETGKEWGLTFSHDDAEQRLIQAFTFGKQVDLELFKGMLTGLRVSESDFIEAYRRFLTVEKMASLLARSSIGSKETLYEDLKRREQKRNFLYIPFSHASYRDKVTVKDEDVQSQFQQNRTTKYMEPRKIRLRAAVLSFDAMKADIAVPDDETQAYYEKYKDYLYVKETAPDTANADGTVTPGAKTYFPLADVHDKIVDNLRYEVLPEHAAKQGADVQKQLEQWLTEKRDAQRAAEEEKRKAAHDDKGESKTEDGKAPEEKPVEDKPEEPVSPAERDVIKFKDNELLVDFAALTKIYGDKVRIIDIDYFDPLDKKMAENTFLKEVYSEEFVRAAQRLAKHKISDVIVANDKTVICQLVAESTRGVPDLAAIRDRVKEDYIAKVTQEIAEKDAAEKFALLKDDIDIAKLAKNQNLELKTSGFVPNPQYKKDAGKVAGIAEEDKELFKSVFEQEPNQAREVNAATAAYIFTVFDVQDPKITDVDETNMDRALYMSRRNNLDANRQRIDENIRGAANAKVYAAGESIKDAKSADATAGQPDAAKPAAKPAPKKPGSVKITPPKSIPVKKDPAKKN